MSRLFYAIVVADPKTKGNSEFRKVVKRRVITNRSKIATHRIEGGKIYINRFNSVCAEMDLTWALEFWSKKREAKAANNPSKCDNCEYNFQCRQSGGNQDFQGLLSMVLNLGVSNLIQLYFKLLPKAVARNSRRKPAIDQ